MKKEDFFSPEKLGVRRQLPSTHVYSKERGIQYQNFFFKNS